MTDIPSLIVIVALVVAAAASGARYAPGPWYKSLKTPSWTPPDWAFPVVWTILYAMIAAAGWFAWRAGGLSVAMIVWGVGLMLNFLWSYIMFGRKRIFLALVDVTLLWLATAAFIVLVWDLDQTAAFLFIPYLAWVTVAAALNFQVWRLNPASSDTA